MEVRGREEQVVGDDRERRRGRHASEDAERHGDGGHRREREQPDVHRAGQLGIPGGVGLVEGVPVGPPVQTVGEEGAQMQEHDRTGQHPQQREGPHADRAAEQVVEAGDQAADVAARANRGRVHPAPPRTRLRRTSTPGWVGVVPGRDRRLQVPGLAVAGSVVCDPVERGVEERQLIGEPGVRVVADRGVAQPPVLHQLVPAVARPRTLDRDAPAVGGDPDHVGAPGARLGEHLERELLVVGPVAPGHEPELQDHDGHDHHPPHDDPDPRPHAVTMTRTGPGVDLGRPG